MKLAEVPAGPPTPQQVRAWRLAMLKEIRRIAASERANWRLFNSQEWRQKRIGAALAALAMAGLCAGGAA